MDARRAQSFPDHEVIVGNPAQQWKIVGNSVARTVALALGLSLRQAWEQGAEGDEQEAPLTTNGMHNDEQADRQDEAELPEPEVTASITQPEEDANTRPQETELRQERPAKLRRGRPTKRRRQMMSGAQTVVPLTAPQNALASETNHSSIANPSATISHSNDKMVARPSAENKDVERPRSKGVITNGTGPPSSNGVSGSLDQPINLDSDVEEHTTAAVIATARINGHEDVIMPAGLAVGAQAEEGIDEDEDAIMERVLRVSEWDF
jgi:hypothetical protein